MLREQCSRFSAEYHRTHDAVAPYPEEFVAALTEAGWLAAMIPDDHGGSGLACHGPSDPARSGATTTCIPRPDIQTSTAHRF